MRPSKKTVGIFYTKLFMSSDFIGQEFQSTKLAIGEMVTGENRDFAPEIDVEFPRSRRRSVHSQRHPLVLPLAKPT